MPTTSSLVASIPDISVCLYKVPWEPGIRSEDAKPFCISSLILQPSLHMDNLSTGVRIPFTLKCPSAKGKVILSLQWRSGEESHAMPILPYFAAPTLEDLTIDEFSTDTLSFSTPRPLSPEPYFRMALHGSDPGPLPPISPGRTSGARRYVLRVYVGLNLSISLTGSFPRAFVAVKSSKEAEEHAKAASCTHAYASSRHVLWNEALLLQIKDDSNIFIAVIDAITRRYMGSLTINVHGILCNEYYNFAMLLNQYGSFVLFSLYALPYESELVEFYRQHEQVRRMEVFVTGFSSLRMPKGTHAITLCAHVGDQTYLSTLQAAVEGNTEPPSMPFHAERVSHETVDLRMTSSHKLFTFVEVPVWNEMQHMDCIDASMLYLEIFCMATPPPRLARSDARVFFAGYAYMSLSSCLEQEAGIPYFQHLPIHFGPSSKQSQTEQVTLGIELRQWKAEEYVAYLQDEPFEEVCANSIEEPVEPSMHPSSDGRMFGSESMAQAHVQRQSNMIQHLAQSLEEQKKEVRNAENIIQGLRSELKLAKEEIARLTSQTTTQDQAPSPNAS